LRMLFVQLRIAQSPQALGRGSGNAMASVPRLANDGRERALWRGLRRRAHAGDSEVPLERRRVGRGGAEDVGTPTMWHGAALGLPAHGARPGGQRRGDGACRRQVQRPGLDGPHAARCAGGHGAAQRERPRVWGSRRAAASRAEAPMGARQRTPGTSSGGAGVATSSRRKVTSAPSGAPGGSAPPSSSAAAATATRGEGDLAGHRRPARAGPSPAWGPRGRRAPDRAGGIWGSWLPRRCRGSHLIDDVSMRRQRHVHGGPGEARPLMATSRRTGTGRGLCSVRSATAACRGGSGSGEGAAAGGSSGEREGGRPCSRSRSSSESEGRGRWTPIPSVAAPPAQARSAPGARPQSA